MKITGPLSNIEFYADSVNPNAIYAEVVVPGDASPSESYELFVDINDDRLKKLHQVVYHEAKRYPSTAQCTSPRHKGCH